MAKWISKFKGARQTKTEVKKFFYLKRFRISCTLREKKKKVIKSQAAISFSVSVHEWKAYEEAVGIKQVPWWEGPQLHVEDSALI